MVNGLLWRAQERSEQTVTEMESLTYNPLDPQHIIVGIAELMERYGRKKTTICVIVNDPRFPGEIAPRRWRMDHVLRYEDLLASRKRDMPAHSNDVADTTAGTLDQEATLNAPMTTPPSPLTAAMTVARSAARSAAALEVLASRRAPRKAVK